LAIFQSKIKKTLQKKKNDEFGSRSPRVQSPSDNSGSSIRVEINVESDVEINLETTATCSNNSGDRQ
jgi:hypothetical protein